MRRRVAPTRFGVCFIKHVPYLLLPDDSAQKQNARMTAQRQVPACEPHPSQEPHILFHICKTKIQQGNSQAALAVLRKALRQNAQSLELLIYTSYCFHFSGHYEAARKAFKQAREMSKLTTPTPAPTTMLHQAQLYFSPFDFLPVELVVRIFELFQEDLAHQQHPYVLLELNKTLRSLALNAPSLWRNVVWSCDWKVPKAQDSYGHSSSSLGALSMVAFYAKFSRDTLRHVDLSTVDFSQCPVDLPAQRLADVLGSSRQTLVTALIDCPIRRFMSIWLHLHLPRLRNTQMCLGCSRCLRYGTQSMFPAADSQVYPDPKPRPDTPEGYKQLAVDGSHIGSAPSTDHLVSRVQGLETLSLRVSKLKGHYCMLTAAAPTLENLHLSTRFSDDFSGPGLNFPRLRRLEVARTAGIEIPGVLLPNGWWFQGESPFVPDAGAALQYISALRCTELKMTTPWRTNFEELNCICPSRLPAIKKLTVQLLAAYGYPRLSTLKLSSHFAVAELTDAAGPNGSVYLANLEEFTLASFGRDAESQRPWSRDRWEEAPSLSGNILHFVRQRSTLDPPGLSQSTSVPTSTFRRGVSKPQAEPAVSTPVPKGRPVPLKRLNIDGFHVEKPLYGALTNLCKAAGISLTVNPDPEDMIAFPYMVDCTGMTRKRKAVGTRGP